MNRLVAEAAFTGDQAIFEFACGTGPLAARPPVWRASGYGNVSA
jgi:hypothetical protein